MIHLTAHLRAAALVTLAAFTVCALAERPTPARSKTPAHSTRIHAQTAPSQPVPPSGKSGKARSKAHTGKTTPHAKTKHHHHRLDNVDDPIEVKRAHTHHQLVHSPAPVLRASSDRVPATHVSAPIVDPGELILPDDSIPATTHPSSPPEDAAAPVPDLFHPANHRQLAEEAVQPIVLPGLYRNGRLIVPAPLKGSRDVLVHQNQMADDEGLSRIEDDEELTRLRDAHLLVRLPESASLHINQHLPVARRYARPWTVKFATDTANAFAARFHQPLQVNSAVRTVAYQLRLQRTNGNAASVDGDTASPHLTGQAIDIGKRGLTTAQIAWMRDFLLPLMHAGKIDVEEEFQQACFHISVYRSYAPPPVKRSPHTEVATLHPARSPRTTPRDNE